MRNNNKNISDYILGFYLASHQKYYEVLKSINPEEINSFMIGRYAETGGCLYEFKITWTTLDQDVVSKVNIYDSSLVYFDDFKHVLDCFKEIAIISKNNTPSPSDFRDALINIGLTELGV